MAPLQKHCPNLVLSPKDKKLHNFNAALTHNCQTTVGVKVNYNSKSLAQYWVNWYKEYMEAGYPRLIVRFKDLQFHAKEMIGLICQCDGTKAKNNGMFTYMIDYWK